MIVGIIFGCNKTISGIIYIPLKIVCAWILQAKLVLYRPFIHYQHLLQPIWTFNKHIPLPHEHTLISTKQFVRYKFNGSDQAFLSYLKKLGTQIHAYEYIEDTTTCVFKTDCTMGNIIISCSPSFFYKDNMSWCEWT